MQNKVHLSTSLISKSLPTTTLRQIKRLIFNLLLQILCFQKEHPTSRVPHKDVRHPIGGRDANVRRHIPLMSCFLLKTSYLCIFLLLFLLSVAKIFKFIENEV